MARTIKPAHIRRAELLDVAQRLFFTRGYEATSVNKILAAVKLSKGAFYHHFRSKEELLDALVERATDGAVDYLERLNSTVGVSAMDKVNAFFRATRTVRADHADTVKVMLKALYEPSNYYMRRAIEERTLVRSGPGLARLIAEGAANGEFLSSNPPLLAELLLKLNAEVNGDVGAAMRPGGPDRGALDLRMLGYADAMRRLLGTHESVTLCGKDFLNIVLDQSSSAPAQATAAAG